MITIDRLSMDFKMSRLEFTKELYGSWESFCRNSVEKVIDETLSPFNRDREVIEIDELDIEIGYLTETEFYEKFPLLFHQKLHEQFARLLNQADCTERGRIRIRPLHSALLDIWIFFLHNGYVPSDFSELFRNPGQVFETLMEDNPGQMVEALQREWHHTRFGRRFTEQLRDEQLLLIIEVEEPEQALFIARFICSTQPLRLDTGNGRGSSSDHRAVLWIATYSFLFFNHQSIFSRKEYLRHTVRELSAHYNLNFKETLLFLRACFNKKEGDSTASHILNILEELIEEETRDAKKEERTPIVSEKISRKKTRISERLLKKEEKEASKGDEKEQISPETITQKESETISARTKKLMYHFTVALEKEFLNFGYHSKTFEELRQLVQFAENEWNTLSFEKETIIEKIRTILQELSRLRGIDFRALVIRLQEGIPAGEKYYFSSILHNLLQIKTEHKDQETDIGKNADTGNQKAELMSNIPGNSSIIIENAGLVLLSPYLQRLFSTLKLTAGVGFVDTNAQIKAIFLLQELLSNRKTEYHEHELFLNKLLVGFTKISDTLPLSVPLDETERTTCKSLLEGCRANWSILKNTSLEGLCESFIRRNGKLEKKETHWSLKVQEKSFDILLDSLPWSFSPINYPWMAEPIFVQWR